jgi:hypothetical protein
VFTGDGEGAGGVEGAVDRHRDAGGGVSPGRSVCRTRDHLIKPAPRTSHKEVSRHKAYGHTTHRKNG